MNIEVSLPPGTKCHFLGSIPGIITAVTIRDGYQVHEFSYLDKEGSPKVCMATKHELERRGSSRMGFGGKDDSESESKGKSKV